VEQQYQPEEISNMIDKKKEDHEADDDDDEVQDETNLYVHDDCYICEEEQDEEDEQKKEEEEPTEEEKERAMKALEIMQKQRQEKEDQEQAEWKRAQLADDDDCLHCINQDATTTTTTTTKTKPASPRTDCCRRQMIKQHMKPNYDCDEELDKPRATSTKTMDRSLYDQGKTYISNTVSWLLENPIVFLTGSLLVSFSGIFIWKKRVLPLLTPIPNSSLTDPLFRDIVVPIHK
jgi:hypothetical protein